MPEAERAAVASDLFGSRAGLIFTRVDGAALRTAAQDVSRFGVAISEVDADQIELTNDALSRMSLAGRGLANQVTVALAPALQSLSDRAADLANWFNGLSDGTKRIIATTGLIAGAAGPAALALGLMLKISAPLAVAMGAVVSTVALAPLRFAAAAKSAIALEIALGATSTKAAVASLAIKGLQRGLVLLRGAVIATGIGALVVGAGYLAMKFHQLVVATGGWGAALRALGTLAVGVWEGIKTSAAAIKPSLAAIWSQVQAGFTRMLQDLSLNWGNFLWTLSQGMRGLPGLSEVQQSLRNASDQAIDKVMELDLAASSLEGRVIRLAELSEGVQELAQDWDGTVAAFESSLAALQDAIESAEAFSYEDLVGALDVAVTLDDSAPDWLRALVEQADTGIRTTLDFIIRRDDLTAADRWIAMRLDRALSVTRAGDSLTLNGETFDFTPLQEGDVLPRDAVACSWLASDVTRQDGEIRLTLILPHGPHAPERTRFPQPVTLTEDGPVSLPAYQTETAPTEEPEA